MAKQRINNSAKESVKKKKIVKFLKWALVIIFLLLLNIYIVLRFVYKEKSFTVYLENEEYTIEHNLTIYENSENKRPRKFLTADVLDSFSNISMDWLPENIHQEAEGSHNGNNYIAYTFYAENQGHETINYHTEIVLDDVIREVDEAVRVIVYKNDQKTIYAKTSKATGLPEEGTKPFVDEDTIMLETTYNFKVGDIDKYTVVIFVEGNDPECTDTLIGGEIGLHMTLREEQLPDPEPGEEPEESENN